MQVDVKAEEPVGLPVGDSLTDEAIMDIVIHKEPHSANQAHIIRFPASTGDALRGPKAALTCSAVSSVPARGPRRSARRRRTVCRVAGRGGGGGGGEGGGDGEGEGGGVPHG